MGVNQIMIIFTSKNYFEYQTNEWIREVKNSKATLQICYFVVGRMDREKQ